MKLYYTGAEKGGLPQTSPNLSLGGYVSSSPVPNGSINNVFGGISQYGMNSQVKQVRAVVLKNESGASVNPKVWYNNVSSEPITNYRLAFATLAQSDCGWYMEKIGAGDAMPLAATFINPLTQVNEVSLPPLPADGYIGIWIERTYNSAAVANSQSCQTLLSKFESQNTYQVSSIKFVADVTNSLDGKHLLLDTPKEKYLLWFSTGAGAAQPASVGREPIKITIATNDNATTVAQKVRNQIALLIDPRGEMTTTIDATSSDTVVLTAGAFGAFPIPQAGDSGSTVTAVTAGTFNGLETLEKIELNISY